MVLLLLMRCDATCSTSSRPPPTPPLPPKPSRRRRPPEPRPRLKPYWPPKCLSFRFPGPTRCSPPPKLRPARSDWRWPPVHPSTAVYCSAAAGCSTLQQYYIQQLILNCLFKSLWWICKQCLALISRYITLISSVQFQSGVKWKIEFREKKNNF